MAYVIAVINQKGGVGKTTTTINLAGAFIEMGYTVAIVDSDVQGNSRDWKEVNEENEVPVLGIDRPTIHKDIHTLSRFDIVLIDGAPTVKEMSISAIKAADLALIPVQPSALDVWATTELVKLVKQRIEITDEKLKATFVVSRSSTRKKVTQQISGVLADFELPVLDNHIPDYADFASCIAVGKSVTEFAKNSKAAQGIRLVAKEIQEKYLPK